MSITAIAIITTLVAFILGGGAFVLWFIADEARERRCHYKITLTITPDGRLESYESKLTEPGRDALTIVPFEDTQIADIDIRLSDGKAVVFDLRPKG